MSWLNEAAETVGEALFPTNIYCVCCGSIIDETRVYGICDNCIEKFQFATEHLCEKCGKILSDYTGRRTTCFDCRYREHSFRKGYTCAGYGLYERAMIMDLKYQGESILRQKNGKADGTANAAGRGASLGCGDSRSGPPKTPVAARI